MVKGALPPPPFGRLPRDIFGQMNKGSALRPLVRRASPGAVIGIPACTANPVSDNLIKDPLLHLAKNIPEREAEPRKNPGQPARDGR